jgi:hypothetical protein
MISMKRKSMDLRFMSNLLFLKTRDKHKFFESSKDSKIQRENATFLSGDFQGHLLKQNFRLYLSLMVRLKVSRSFRQLMVTMLQEPLSVIRNQKVLH